MDKTIVNQPQKSTARVGKSPVADRTRPPQPAPNAPPQKKVSITNTRANPSYHDACTHQTQQLSSFFFFFFFFFFSSSHRIIAVFHNGRGIALLNRMICQFCRGALRAQRTAATSSLRSVSRIATSHRSAPPSSIAIIARSAAPRASWASSFTALRQFSSTSTRCSSREGAIADASAAAEPPSMTAAETAIADLLSSKLHPTELLVQDVSGGCGSMYAIDITSAAFRGQTILKQQRMVNAALGETMKGWHGVQIRTKVAPEAA